MRLLLSLFLFILTPLVCADNVSHYRAAYMAHCGDDEPDAEGQKMCACVFDEWAAQLASKTDKHAVMAAKLLANVEGDYYPSDMQQAAQHMQAIQEISFSCLDKFMGPIHIGGDNSSGSDDSTTDDNTYGASPSVPRQSEPKGRGMFGAVVGWAGKKAGLPDVVNEAAADKADANEGSIREKFNPLNSKFNPFKKGSDDE